MKTPSSRSAVDMDCLTRITVVDASGSPARFESIRVETQSGPVATVGYQPGKTDPYVLQYKLKKDLPSIRLVLVDAAGEHPADIKPGTQTYRFTSTLRPEVDPGDSALSASNVSPLQVLNLARRAVPAVNYALGIAGIAAAGAIITIFLGWTKAGIVLIALIFVGMVLLFAFSQLIAAKSRAIQAAGTVLLWAVLLFFVIFLVFTVTAFGTGQPSLWAKFLGIVGSEARADASQPSIPGQRPVASSRKYDLPASLHLCEGTANICGDWVKTGEASFLAKWPGGYQSAITVLENREDGIRFYRADMQAAPFRAIYNTTAIAGCTGSGKCSLSGNVQWTWPDNHSESGVWSAEGAAQPSP